MKWIGGGRSPLLVGVAFLAVTLLLLSWGLAASQWTILSNNNDLHDALPTSMDTRETFHYSIPQGQEEDFPITIGVSPSEYNCGIVGFPGAVGIPSACLTRPVSNLSTTVNDYVVFSFTNPNGSAMIIWFTGPQGNFSFSQACGGVVVECHLEPSGQGVRLTFSPFAFPVLSPGNYTMHALGASCIYGQTCTTTDAIGSGGIAVSTIIYDRPYWFFGLATVIAAGVSIATAIGFLAVTFFRRRHGGGIHPKTASSPLRDID